jgi:hypothetical protein
MRRHFAAFLEAHGFSSDLIVIHQYLPIGEAVEQLLLIWQASELDEWRNRMVRIPLR